MVLTHNLSHAQRVSLATLLTMLAVGVLEIAHFSRGTSLLLGVGYFAIPAMVAAALFKTLKERAVALVFLTAAGFLSVAVTILFYATP